jgi:restriction endonuclease S subunit
MHKTKLKDIAQISGGQLLRHKPDYVSSGGYPLVQLKDVVPDEPLDWGQMARARVGNAKEAYMLREGDVLVKAKGQNHLAAVSQAPQEPVLVTSQLIIIRLASSDVLPEYLAWYINQPSAQQRIDRLSVGSNIRHLSVKQIGELEIEVPPIKTQEIIVNLYRLRLKEQRLVDRIQNLRGQLLRECIQLRT